MSDDPIVNDTHRDAELSLLRRLFDRVKGAVQTYESDAYHRGVMDAAGERQPVIQIYPSTDKREDGKAQPHRWRLVAGNGEKQAHGGEFFDGQDNCETAVEDAIRNMVRARIEITEG